LLIYVIFVAKNKEIFCLIDVIFVERNKEIFSLIDGAEQGNIPILIPLFTIVFQV
jgi:hypothetical protein